MNRVKLLFIGDIVGQPGRRAVAELVPALRTEHGIDFVVANGENSAGGSGITPKTAEEIFAAGIDVITSGDHLWDQKEVVELLDGETLGRRSATLEHAHSAAYPPAVSPDGKCIVTYSDGMDWADRVFLVGAR